MTRSSITPIAFGTPAVLALVLAANIAAAAPYTITDLGTLGGGRSVPQAINSAGSVVGESITSDGKTHAFLYNGTMHDLGTLAGDYSSAFGINRFGQVVGQSSSVSGSTHAFRYDGAIHDLGAPGLDASYAAGVSGNGDVAVNSFIAGVGPNAFIYSNGVMQPLGTLGGSFSHAYDMNDAGQIVGDAYLPGNMQRAAMWDGTWHDLGTLGAQSVALGISTNGLVAGSAVISPGQSHAFFHDGSIHDLGTLGGISSVGQGVNSSGVVVGWSRLLIHQHHTRFDTRLMKAWSI